MASPRSLGEEFDRPQLAGTPLSMRPSPDAPRDSLTSLQRMVDPDDLRVVFQPIVDLSNGRLFATEALVRCRVPEYASPPALFERAVEWQCVGRLGRLIRDIAFPLAAGTPLFINVHPSELSEGWLVRPDDPMYFHDHDVYVEVTESVPLTHTDLCMSVIREVCSRGSIYPVVDDLGAGYSNLRRIADFAPKVVKLDRGLVAGLDQNRRQRVLVRSLVRLCRDLGASVVAEGIETRSELLALVDCGAHYGQGFYLARPSYPPKPVHWPLDADGRDKP